MSQINVEDYGSAVCIDIGSKVVKAGFGGEDSPMAVLPSVTAVPLVKTAANKSSYVGDEVIKKRDELKLTWPIQKGLVTDWDLLEKILFHVFYIEVRVGPEDSPTVLNEPLFNSKQNRERLTEIMFESVSVPAYSTGYDQVYSLHAAGKTSGLVLDLGGGYSKSVCIDNGNVILPTAAQSDICGHHVTTYLQKSIKSGVPLTEDIVDKIKEEHAYIEYDPQLERAYRGQYSLPDGTVITLRSEMSECNEYLFNSTNGIQSLVSKSISAQTGDNQFSVNDLVLTGGLSQTRGLEARLKKELQATSIHAPNERKFGTWLGQSLKSIASETLWVSKDTYDEEGSQAIHKLF